MKNPYARILKKKEHKNTKQRKQITMKTQNKYKKTIDLQSLINGDCCEFFSMKDRNFGHRLTKTFHEWLAECKRHDEWHDVPEFGERVENLANVVAFLENDYCDLRLELDNGGEVEMMRELDNEIFEQEKLEKNGWRPSLDLQIGNQISDSCHIGKWRIHNGDGTLIGEGSVDLRVDGLGDYLSLFAAHLLDTERYEKVTDYFSLSGNKKI